MIHIVSLCVHKSIEVGGHGIDLLKDSFLSFLFMFAFLHDHRNKIQFYAPFELHVYIFRTKHVIQVKLKFLFQYFWLTDFEFFFSSKILRLSLLKKKFEWLMRMKCVYKTRFKNAFNLIHFYFYIFCNMLLTFIPSFYLSFSPFLSL